MIDPLDLNSLKPAREAAGLSRAELADLAGVDETTVLRIERGLDNKGVDPRLHSTWAPIVKALQGLPARPFAKRTRRAVGRNPADARARGGQGGEGANHDPACAAGEVARS